MKGKKTTKTHKTGSLGPEQHPEGLKISKEAVAALPLVKFEKKIIVVDNFKSCRQAVNFLKKQAVIGFDTETRPAFKKGQRNKVALLQLSTMDQCFLFRLNKIGIPSELVKLLSNPEILKIGLSIKDDFMTMRRLVEFDPDGFVELQTLVKNYNIAEASLQKVYALIFKEKISKSQRLSNWEAVHLTEAQKKYAAIDAWACLKIYYSLTQGGV